MIASTRRWLKRNKTPLAISLGVAGAGYVATQYILGKIADARERMSSDRIARENLRRRFEQNQEDCTFTVLALLPTATENILNELQTEKISDKLREYKASNLTRSGELKSEQSSGLGSGPPSVTDDDGRSMASQSESGVHASMVDVASTTGEGPQTGGQKQQGQSVRPIKARLWEELKISAITRMFTMIYTLALLTLLTRVQLNLLGRRSYLSSVVSLATGSNEQAGIKLENRDDDNFDQSYGNDFETNRRYLTFSWWLLHRGWRDIMLKVQGAVKEVFDKLSVIDSVDLQEFSILTLEVRKKIEGATEEERKDSKWLEYLLPPKEQEDFVLKESGMTTSTKLSGSTSLRRLLDETADLIESPPFTHVLTLLLDAGFSTLVDTKLAELAFELPPVAPIPNLNAPRLTELNDRKPVKLPKVLAPCTKQALVIGDGVSNEYLTAMEQVSDLEAFAVVVYSSNWETEMRPPTEESTGSDKTGIKPEGSNASVQESFVDVGTASSFESAWGKAGGKAV